MHDAVAASQPLPSFRDSASRDVQHFCWFRGDTATRDERRRDANCNHGMAAAAPAGCACWWSLIIGSGVGGMPAHAWPPLPGQGLFWKRGWTGKCWFSGEPCYYYCCCCSGGCDGWGGCAWSCCGRAGLTAARGRRDAVRRLPPAVPSPTDASRACRVARRAARPPVPLSVPRTRGVRSRGCCAPAPGCCDGADAGRGSRCNTAPPSPLNNGSHTQERQMGQTESSCNL